MVGPAFNAYGVTVQTPTGPVNLMAGPNITIWPQGEAVVISATAPPNTGTSSGTGVTAISIASSNGFTGSSSGGATPTITLSTSITGLLKGNGTAISAAIPGTDYQPAGSYIAGLTGDISATGPGSAVATLATVNSNVGSFTAANITVNAKGLITAASNGTVGNVTGPASSTDNAIVRFDGTTGKIIQDYTSNPPTITDTGQVFIGPAGISPTSTGTAFNTYCTDMTSNVILNSFQALGAIPAAGNIQALQFNITDSGTANVSTITGINGLAVKAGSGSVTTMNGIAGGVRITGTATATTMASFSATARVLVGCSATTVVGFSAAGNVVTGSVAAAYGAKIAAQKITNVTTGYGFASDGALDLNYMAGKLFVGATTDNGSGKILQITGDVVLTTAGNALYIKQGTGGMFGDATLVSGTIAITITGLTTSDRAFTQLITPSGTAGANYKSVCTANTLTITSVTTSGATQATDTSTLTYFIIRPS